MPADASEPQHLNTGGPARLSPPTDKARTVVGELTNTLYSVTLRTPDGHAPTLRASVTAFAEKAGTPCATYVLRHTATDVVAIEAVLDRTLALALMDPALTAVPVPMYGHARRHPNGHIGIQLFWEFGGETCARALAAAGTSASAHPAHVTMTDDMCLITGPALLAFTNTAAPGDDFAEIAAHLFSTQLGVSVGVVGGRRHLP